jgi:hypothetical protein
MEADSVRSTLRLIDVQLCQRCGLGLLRNGPIFYEVEVTTHAAKLAEIKERKLRPGDIMSEIMGARKGLVCMGCFSGGDKPYEGNQQDDVGEGSADAPGL